MSTNPGRWPANVIISADMAEVIDGQSGISKSPAPYLQRTNSEGQVYGLGSSGNKEGRVSTEHGDSGGASRFFLNVAYEPWELEWIYTVGLRPYGTEEA